YREALNRYVESAGREVSYTDGQLVGQARPDGSVDLLLGRGTRDIRITRIDSTGKMVFDETLTEPMDSKERPPRRDGFIDGNAVTVFGELGLKEKRLQRVQARVAMHDPVRVAGGGLHECAMTAGQ
ncbi:MAG: hypothetical protein KJO13_04530, partial [Gammaproteobacteria bacterium]|nr:hypothetical protein [Gammaproteobacteria bacterium]